MSLVAGKIAGKVTGKSPESARKSRRKSRRRNCRRRVAGGSGFPGRVMGMGLGWPGSGLLLGRLGRGPLVHGSSQVDGLPGWATSFGFVGCRGSRVLWFLILRVVGQGLMLIRSVVWIIRVRAIRLAGIATGTAGFRFWPPSTEDWVPRILPDPSSLRFWVGVHGSGSVGFGLHGSWSRAVLGWRLWMRPLSSIGTPQRRTSAPSRRLWKIGAPGSRGSSDFCWVWRVLVLPRVTRISQSLLLSPVSHLNSRLNLSCLCFGQQRRTEEKRRKERRIEKKTKQKNKRKIGVSFSWREAIGYKGPKRLKQQLWMAVMSAWAGERERNECLSWRVNGCNECRSWRGWWAYWNV